jgi:hypothetical protein
MRQLGSRTQLVVIAAVLLVLIVVEVAIAGPSGGEGPSAIASAVTVKKLNKKVRGLSSQVSQLQGEVAALQAKQGSPAPPTGPASGDLTGDYPGPSLKGPGPVTSAGLSTEPSGGCAVVPDGWYNASQLGIDPKPVGYYRDRQGRVFLQGVAIKCGSGNSLIFTLPPGFRPAKIEDQPTAVSGGLSQVRLASTGEVRGSNTLAGQNLSLDGVNIRCAPSGADGCP